jgi:uncharacterized protein YneF (UPF0154 family)
MSASHVLYIPLIFAAGVVVGLWIARLSRRKDDDA